MARGARVPGDFSRRRSRRGVSGDDFREVEFAEIDGDRPRETVVKRHNEQSKK